MESSAECPQGILGFGVRASSFGVPLGFLGVPGLAIPSRFLEDPMRTYENPGICKHAIRVLKDC